jgi:hypothetical protein
MSSFEASPAPLYTTTTCTPLVYFAIALCNSPRRSCSPESTCQELQAVLQGSSLEN